MKKDNRWRDAHVHIARYALPLVEDLRYKGDAHPSEFNSMDDWHAVLDSMIYALSVIARDDGLPCEAIGKCVKEGMKLFGIHFQNLWD